MLNIKSFWKARLFEFPAAGVSLFIFWLQESINKFCSHLKEKNQFLARLAMGAGTLGELTKALTAEHLYKGELSSLSYCGVYFLWCFFFAFLILRLFNPCLCMCVCRCVCICLSVEKAFRVTLGGSSATSDVFSHGGGFSAHVPVLLWEVRSILLA